MCHWNEVRQIFLLSLIETWVFGIFWDWNQFSISPRKWVMTNSWNLTTTWPRGWGSKQVFGVNHLISILKLVSTMYPSFQTTPKFLLHNFENLLHPCTKPCAIQLFWHGNPRFLPDVKVSGFILISIIKSCHSLTEPLLLG